MPPRRGQGRPRIGAALAAAAAACVISVALVAVARAEWRLGVAAEEGVSLMGGPIGYRMARDPEAAPDAVTGASVDGVTAASRVSHAGGVHLELRRNENLGALVLGVEYVHYRFDLDYTTSRADLDVVALRLLLLPRLVVVRFRGRPLLSFGMGAYLELALYDRAEVAAEMIDLEVAPAAVGLAFDLRLEHFVLELGRGRLIPALVLRGYRGLITQLRDEQGSAAPLASITLGLGVRYERPSPSQGNGRSGR